MSEQVLSLSARPQTLDELVGARNLVKMIRGHMTSGRVPAAWMFVGGSGAGKTTTARIVALSLQCTHQDIFGNPCADCQSHRSSFDITEINAAEASGVEETEQVIAGAFYNSNAAFEIPCSTSSTRRGLWHGLSTGFAQVFF